MDPVSPWVECLAWPFTKVGLTQSSCQGMDEHGRWSPSSAQEQHGVEDEEEEASEVDAKDITKPKDVRQSPGMMRKFGCAVAVIISGTLAAAVFYIIIFIE